MILPERVLGSSSVNRIDFGLAIGPMAVRHVVAQLLDELVGWARCPPRRVTNAAMACPVVASVLPTTAASATAGWSTSADSTSVVEMLWPETSMTSSTRPSSQK